MVPGPGRHAHERQAVLDRDRGHQRLGAVTAGHAQAVSATGDGVASELLEVEAVIEHDHLHPQFLGEPHQSELLDLAATRPRVAQQHRMSGRRDVRRPAGVALVQVAHQRGAAAHHHDQEERGHQHEAQHGPIGFGRGVEDGDDDQHRTDRRPRDADGPARQLLGDHPPGTRGDQGQTHQTDEQGTDVTGREDQRRHHEHRAGHQRRHGQHAPADPNSFVAFHGLHPLPFRSSDRGRPGRSWCPG